MDDEVALVTSDSDSDSDSSGLESDKEPRWMKHKKHHPKVEIKQKKEEPAPKAPEAKVQDSAEPTKNNIDNLAEKIGRLTIALNSFDGDKAA
jgi:hypothetical protein